MQSEFNSILNPKNEVHRYQALLDLADLIVRHYSLSELFHELAQRLQRVAEFQLLHFSFYDPKENVMRRYLSEGEGPIVPEAVAIPDSASGLVGETQTPLLIRDLQALLEERRRLQALVDVNRELVSSLEMQRLLPLISECVTRVVPHDFAGGVTIYEDDRKAMKASR
jgi:hypothetical protein